MITSLQILLSVTFLGIASIYDMRTREVPNTLWLIFLPFALVLTIMSLALRLTEYVLVLASILVTTVIALLIFYLGLFGGADAKALIILSLAHPIATIPPIQTSILPLTTLTNSLLLMLILLPYAMVKNLSWKIKTQGSLFQELDAESIWKKIAALFLCVKVSKSMIKPYNMIAERKIIDEGTEGRRSLTLFQKISDEDTRIDESVPDDVFIVYSLPMLPFIMLSYIITLTIGDLIFHILTKIA